ncbi:RluA family pseudouridine synthase [Buchnera aphidicola]|uniref:RluA family pseudouridine synthase n=1 Tax=Buchnera aphidicola TaxID=9 RepID=UPI001650E452|nr:RluA family pseudouridine synthase [Buchnera aphidicola]
MDQILNIYDQTYSRSFFKQCIKNNQVLVNNKICTKPSKKVFYGDKILLIHIIQNINKYKLNQLQLNIVYEDDYMLIINKQSGLVVHPGIKNLYGTLLDMLIQKYPDLQYIPRGGIIHRLDKNTTGLMIIAKKLESYFWFNSHMRRRKIFREYETIVYGILLKNNTIINNIIRHPIYKTKMSVGIIGKKAVTHYKILNNFFCFTHLRINLETGRTHQIRLHMENIGHPILGDPIYYNKKKKSYFIKKLNVKKLIQNIERPLLHAKKIVFFHPLTKKIVKIEIPLPEDMCDCIKNIINFKL